MVWSPSSQVFHVKEKRGVPSELPSLKWMQVRGKEKSHINWFFWTLVSPWDHFPALGGVVPQITLITLSPTRLLRSELPATNFGKLKKYVSLWPRITGQIHTRKLRVCGKGCKEMLFGDGKKNGSLCFSCKRVELVTGGTSFEEWGKEMM